MTAQPAWASDLICEAHCPLCQRPLVIPLPELLRVQPVGCACGHQIVLPIPPGLPELAFLLETLECLVGQNRARHTAPRRMERIC